MLKKMMQASAVALFTLGVAHASGAPYVGASVGVVTNTNVVKVNGSNFTGGAYRGVPFNLFAGYASILGQNFYLAGELMGTVGTANISDNTGMKSSYGLGVSIIPGVMLTDRTLAYVRAGVLATRFPNDGGETRNAGQFGFGLQATLTQTLDLRGEYDFAAYEAKKASVGGFSGSVAPRQDQFTIGLVYKMD